MHYGSAVIGPHACRYVQLSSGLLLPSTPVLQVIATNAKKANPAIFTSQIFPYGRCKCKKPTALAGKSVKFLWLLGGAAYVVVPIDAEKVDVVDKAM